MLRLPAMLSRLDLPFRLVIVVATFQLQENHGDAQTLEPTAPAAATRPSDGAVETPRKRSDIAPVDWHPLLHGSELSGWEVTNFGGEGEVQLSKGALTLEPGSPLTGITYAGKAKLPTTNYEIRLKTRRVAGSDFFCGLTFPIYQSHASLIVGGWGGGLVGISCIDYYDASENETTKYRKFENGRWYAVRLQVTDELLTAWIDGDKILEVETKDHEFKVRAEVELSRPLGFAVFESRVEIKDFEWRQLPPNRATP